MKSGTIGRPVADGVFSCFEEYLPLGKDEVITNATESKISVGLSDIIKCISTIGAYYFDHLHYELNRSNVVISSDRRIIRQSFLPNSEGGILDYKVEIPIHFLWIAMHLFELIFPIL